MTLVEGSTFRRRADPRDGFVVYCAATAMGLELDADQATDAIAAGVAAAGGQPLADELRRSDLCIVAGRRIDDRSEDRERWEPVITESIDAGVPCVVLGDWIDRETAYRLLRLGVRAVTPIGHPRRTTARRKFELIREARVATVQALAYLT